MKSVSWGLKQMLYPLLFIEWVYLYLWGPSHFNGILMGYSWTIFCLVQCALCYRRNQLAIMVMWLFMLMYCFEPARFFSTGEDISFRTQSQSHYTVYYVGLYSYLFNLVLGYSCNIRKIKIAKRLEPIVYKTPFSVWLLCISIGVFMMIIGKSGETILESGGYGRGNVQGSTAFGYAIIPITIAMMYSDNKRRRTIVLIVSALFVVKDLLFGGRIDSLMLILLLYLVYFKYKLKKNQVVLILLGGIIFNQAFEMVRGAIHERSFIEALQGKASNLSLSSGNTQEVYYASMRIIHMIKVGALSSSDRIHSLLYFILAIFVPFSKLPPLAGLASYYRNVYHTGGGGLISVFVYAWGGILGLIIVAGAIGKVLSRFMSGKSGKYLSMYTMFMIATIPRWYAYYPIQLIKLCVYATIIFACTEILRTGKLPSLKIKQRKINQEII